MTLGGFPLSIFCSRGTPSRKVQFDEPTNPEYIIPEKPRKVNVRLPRKGNSKTPMARGRSTKSHVFSKDVSLVSPEKVLVATVVCDHGPLRPVYYYSLEC